MEILRAVIDLKSKSKVEKSSTWLMDIFDVVYFSCFAVGMSIHNDFLGAINVMFLNFVKFSSYSW